MITEIALLRIKPDANAAFEVAFANVMHLLVGADGYIWHRLVGDIERSDLYLLEVEWRDLAAHIELFEPSSAHAGFMKVLEPFFVEEPTVLHVPGRKEA